MSGLDLEVFVTPGLGDNSFLLTSHGEALLVDPQRDAWRFLEAAARRGVRVRAVLETHVHNDYVSGALQVRAATGAEILAPARGGYAFPHLPAREGTTLELGELRLVAWETPGHTPEHLSWVVLQDQDPVAVFSGGSLIVGSVGRSDLLGEDLAPELARLQYRSARRLASLPDPVALLPTHGAGSFCTSAQPSLARTSTIGAERAGNPALAAADEDEFVARHSRGAVAYPAYYAHMAAINRSGPPVLPGPPRPPALDASAVLRHLQAGGWVVDARGREAFARAHLPGSVNVELDSVFATYVGWVVPFGTPLVLVLPDPAPEAAAEAATQLARIGWDALAGYLDGGVEAWRAAGQPLGSYPTANVEDLCHAFLGGRSPAVLDVRQRPEWEQGHIPGSEHVFLGDLGGRLGHLAADREWWVVCASGHRASIAASLLDRNGIRVRPVTRDGVPEWLARCYPALAG